ncbi:MAG TPA: hypothetical protein VMD56_01105 [Steroidobacteraceae bacterium]|nr:hypothetical protein [Steroidobacteraceae bacterium]
MTQSSPKKTEDTAHSRTVPELTLEDTAPELSLEDTAAQQRRGLAVPSPSVGYNPYDTGAPGEQPVQNRASGSRAPPEPPQPARKRTDLRKLSEWIQAQRRAEALRQEQEAEEPKQPPPPQQRK